MIITLKQPAMTLVAERYARTESRAGFFARFDLAAKIQRSNEMEIDIGLLPPADVDALYELAREGGQKSLQQQIGVYRKLVSDPRTVKLTRLQQVEGAVIQWLLADAIDGWVYEQLKDGNHVAWVVTSVRYKAPTMHGRNEPMVHITLAANGPALAAEGQRTAAAVETKTVTISQSALPSTVPEMMTSMGLYHETPELRTLYDETLVRFREIVDHPNEQYVCAPGTLMGAKRENYWTDYRSYDVPHRCVNDETLVRRTYLEKADRVFWTHYEDEGRAKRGGTSTTAATREITSRAFCETPLQPYHLIFGLEDHVQMWAHSSKLSLYVYRTNLREKIVLPDDHRDLVDVLVQDVDVLEEDVIEGKGGGTIVLCRGEPGLGKTLLAECYSEAMSRILYRVTSAQLGTTPDEVASGMKTIMERARRWNAVVLLDEVDVYIRRRGASLEQNAIVANLLQVFEYVLGMVFMTTNLEDIDDAVLSRCLAIIRFERPTAQMARSIWRILADTMGVELPDAEIDRLVAHYQVDGGRSVRTTGRDIKALLKLANRYSMRRGVPVDLDLIVRLAGFKGL